MYLGIDLGTSGVKVLLITDTQTVLASTTAQLQVARPHTGWSEQNPADWITATRQALHDLRMHHDLSSVRAIGLSGQMHGATLLDAAGNVLRPCILWNDTRAHVEAARLDADPQFRALTGNIVFPGFTAPKLAWLKTHEPALFAKVAKVLLPKDYLRYWLTGDFASDMSDAAGTAWLATGARDWSDDLLAATDLTRAQMPTLVEGNAPSGTLRPDIAAEFHLPKTTIVAGGAGDNAASAIGAGVTKAGSAFLSLGTSGVLFASSKDYAPDPDSALHTFCHALPNTWHQMGVILAATDALAWYARLTGTSEQSLTRDLDTLQAPGSTLFLPYLGGERTPHNDAKIRGSFTGLEHITDRAAGTRAVLEGVSYAFRDSLDAMQATGTNLTRVIALGGGANSPYWLRLLASVLNLPVDVPQSGDFGAAFGAARLAMMAHDTTSADIATPPDIARTYEPDPHLVDAFAEVQTRYRATYAALKQVS